MPDLTRLCVHTATTKPLSIEEAIDAYSTAGIAGTPVWNPDIVQPIDFYNSWKRIEDGIDYDNAFKVQWEKFIAHVVADEPFRWDLMEGAKGVQLAEAGLDSWKQRRWIDLEPLE